MRHLSCNFADAHISVGTAFIETGDSSNMAYETIVYVNAELHHLHHTKKKLDWARTRPTHGRKGTREVSKKGSALMLGHYRDFAVGTTWDLGWLQSMQNDIVWQSYTVPQWFVRWWGFCRESRKMVSARARPFEFEAVFRALKSAHDHSCPTFIGKVLKFDDLLPTLATLAVLHRFVIEFLYT